VRKFISKILYESLTKTIAAIITAIILFLWGAFAKESFLKFWNISIPLWIIAIIVIVIAILLVLIIRIHAKYKMQFDKKYMNIVDKLIISADMDNWQSWTSGILSPDPYIYQQQHENLHNLNEYIMSLNLKGGRYSDIDRAIINFRKILQDLLKVFDMHCSSVGLRYTTDKFYRINEWNQEKYNMLLDEFKYHCTLLSDLIIELTRAGNYLFEQIRKIILPAFRFEKGELLITIINTRKVSYAKKDKLYNGLKSFMEDRETRDFHVGNGVSEKYFR